MMFFVHAITRKHPLASFRTSEAGRVTFKLVVEKQPRPSNEGAHVLQSRVAPSCLLESRY